MDVRLLGPIECSGDAGLVLIPGTSAKAVLAMLALRAGEVVFTDEIVEGLWGANLPMDPTAAVHVTISRLRRGLGSDRERLRRVASGYVLDLQPENVDVVRAQRSLDEARGFLEQRCPAKAAQVLAAALAEWRHESPLVELANLPFATSAISALHLLRADITELANDAALESGRPEEVIGRSYRLLAADPWREVLVGQLMVALYQLGRQADGLIAYSELASRLRADFGSEPSPALVHIRSRILSHDPELRRQRVFTDAAEVLPQWFQSSLDQLSDGEDDPRLRCRLRLALGEAQHHAGLPGWQDTLLLAGELARTTGDTALVAKCALGGALGWSVTPGEPDERRLRLLSLALEERNRGSVDEELRARLLAAYANEITFSSSLEERLQYTDQAVALARATGKPTLLLSILNQRFNAIWAPDTLDIRISDSEEANTIAKATQQVLAEEVAAGFAMAAALESGDLNGADHHLNRFVVLAVELRLPVFSWGAKVHTSWRAVLVGDLEEAASLCETARRVGSEANRPEAQLVYLTQRLAIRWAQDRLAEEAQALDQLCAALPGLPGLRAAYALAVYRTGDVDAARNLILREWSDRSIAALPHDQLYLVSLMLWGELAESLAEVEVSRDLFAMLQTYRDRFCFSGAAVFGPVAHVLGLLEEAKGNRSQALDHLEHSVRLSRAMGSPFFAKRSEAAIRRLQ